LNPEDVGFLLISAIYTIMKMPVVIKTAFSTWGNIDLFPKGSINMKKKKKKKESLLTFSHIYIVYLQK